MQQFSIAHEIGHWVLHQNINPQELDKDEYKTIEVEANKFASTLLLPKDSFGNELSSKIVDEIDTYYNLKRKWNVSMAAMIMRARDLNIISARKSTRLNSSHVAISYAVFCLKKKTTSTNHERCDL